jgi:hypothetical protein
MNVRKSAAGRVGVAVLVLAALSACVGQAGAASTPHATSTTPSPSPAVLTLGDNGVGGLALGMSKPKALATGLVGRAAPGIDSDVCTPYYGKQGIDRVYFVNGKVRIIAVKKSIKLDTGIGVGDTLQKLHPAYAVIERASEELGVVYVPAPGAAIHAQYRIGLDTDGAFQDSKITEIALQAYDNGCYE